MDTELAATLQSRLLGCVFGSQALHDAISGTGNAQLEDVAEFLLRENL